MISYKQKLLHKYQVCKKLYLQGHSLNEIIAKEHCDGATLSNFLKKEGIKIVRYGKKHLYNEHVFKHINTEEQSYWLGFLYADGGCSDRHKTVELTLTIKDEVHLKKFIKLMSPTLKPRYKQIGKYKACSVTVYNKNIYNDLVKLGCTPRKTFRLKFPEFLNDNLLRHFIRGYFDGDGCICISNKKYNFSVLGNKDFLTKLQCHLTKHINGLTRTKVGKHCGVHIYQKGGKQQILTIFDYLYHDSTIFLKRKYDKFRLIAVLSSNA